MGGSLNVSLMFMLTLLVVILERSYFILGPYCLQISGDIIIWMKNPSLVDRIHSSSREKQFVFIVGRGSATLIALTWHTMLKPCWSALSFCCLLWGHPSMAGVGSWEARATSVFLRMLATSTCFLRFEIAGSWGAWRSMWLTAMDWWTCAQGRSHWLLGPEIASAFWLVRAQSWSLSLLLEGTHAPVTPSLLCTQVQCGGVCALFLRGIVGNGSWAGKLSLWPSLQQQ